MDITCTANGFIDWVARQKKPPLIWSQHQHTISRNEPSPYLGFVYQATPACAWWAIGGERHPFPAGHLVVLSTHRGSLSAPVGVGGFRVVTFDISHWPGAATWQKRYQWESRRVRHSAALLQAYRQVIVSDSLYGSVADLRVRGALLTFWVVCEVN